MDEKPHSDRDESTPNATESEAIAEEPIDLNSSREGPKYDEAPHEVQTDENAEPDYRATIDEIGFTYDEVVQIENDLYRYRGFRTDSVLLEPLSYYCDLPDDALNLEFVWEAYQEGNIHHPGQYEQEGMIAQVTDHPSISVVEIEPGPAEDSSVLFDLEGVAGSGAFYTDYFYGEDHPALYFYDADREQVAHVMLLPTEENPDARIIQSRGEYYPDNMPEEIRNHIGLFEN